MELLKFEREYTKDIFKRVDTNSDEIKSSVERILDDIKERGDKALIEYERLYDASDISKGMFVSKEEFKEVEALTPRSLKEAILKAYLNIYTFHSMGIPSPYSTETIKGITCSRKVVPIERVGLYVPGGTAPLISTVLMLSIPARIAGCRDILLSTPAKDNKINPALLYAAKLSGVTRILKAGGAQAIGAMAYGTESIEKRDKIFGPGNRYVSTAKSLIQSFCSIDMLAGPSEVMVVIDKDSNTSFAASDLISQAEHGPDSQAFLLIKADDEAQAEKIYQSVEKEIERIASTLPRESYIKESLKNSRAFYRVSNKDIAEAINTYAPEHLILSLEEGEEILDRVENAGSVFMGSYSPVSAGDYASGTNHTLPTSGFARSMSGVSVESFTKNITVQTLTKEGLESIADAIVTLSRAEGLEGHANSVLERLK